MRNVLLNGFAVALAVCAGSPSARADLQWISLTTAQGETVQALFGRPDQGSGPFPAVIYNHGTEVRQNGYDEAGNGTDVKGFVQALNSQGYVALAPIRRFESGTAFMNRSQAVGTPEQWTAAIDGGLRTTAAARAYLAGQREVEPRAIGVLGFSEGGNIALWALIGGMEFKAAVLLAPAAIPQSPRYRIREALNEEALGRIAAPIYLAVATDDIPAVRNAARNQLIPILSKLNRGFAYRDDYPGQHNSFWKVRSDFWTDVSAFLRAHLSTNGP